MANGNDNRFILGAIFVLGLLACSVSVLAECGPEGDATRPMELAANPLKNIGEAPKTIYPAITLGALLAPGDDTNRFSTKGDAATVTGYVAVVKAGGLESCNCHAKDLAHRDTHIALVADPKDYGNAKKYVIVEVTPRFRSQHPDWTTANLKQSILHKKVRVTGWIFFDAEHTNAAENTHPNGAHNWRATCYELHPVTNIELL